MASGLKSFLGQLKSLAGVTSRSIDDAHVTLRSVKTGIVSVDDAIKSLPVTKARGVLLMGEVPVGRVGRVLREGDLPEIIRLSKSRIPYTSADQAAFKFTAKEFPDKALRDVDDLANVHKRNYPELNSTSLDTLSTSGAKQIAKVESNLLKYVKPLSYVALALGGFYVGSNWLKTALAARTGCFMVTTINNKTTSCKIAAFSCTNSTDGTLCSRYPDDLYNITLVLMHIVQLPDTDTLKINLATAVSMQVAELNPKLATLIDNSYLQASTYIKSLVVKPTFSICSITHPQVEGGVVPGCRMCSPSDDPLSTTFIDPALLADNVTLRCSITPSILETVADASITTGKNLLDGVFSGLSGIMKYIYIFGGIIILLVLLAVAFKVIMTIRRKSELSINLPNSDVPYTQL